MEDFDNSTISTDQGLLQVKPETSRDEQMAFIDTMREIQGGQNQEIQDTTHALGSDVTPEFGGINGTNSYWLSRYQTPQTESRIATLRTAAQNSALNIALNNYLNRLQEDYNKTYRKANKRQRNRANAAMYGGGNTGGNDNGYYTPDIDVQSPDEVPQNSAITGVMVPGHEVESYMGPDGFVVEDKTTKQKWVNGILQDNTGHYSGGGSSRPASSLSWITGDTGKKDGGGGW